MAKPGTWFTGETLVFLRNLAENNNRDWFAANRHRDEVYVRQSALRFNMDFVPRPHRISRHFIEDPRPVGGSLSRIHRDTRFSHDKWPFKAHAGNRVPHERNCDVYVPVFYIHVEPGGTFVGVGMWLPDAPMLKTIRDAIVENPTAWRSARDDRAFTAKFELGSAMLARSLRGCDPVHPRIDAFQRENFAAWHGFDGNTLTRDRRLDAFTDAR